MNAPVGVTAKPSPSGVTWTPSAAFGRGFPTRRLRVASLPGEKVSGLPTISRESGVSSTLTATG